MSSDLVLLVFAVAAILVAGAAMHGGRGKRRPYRDSCDAAQTRERDQR